VSIRAPVGLALKLGNADLAADLAAELRPSRRPAG
jgi:hypothetical protein